MKKFIFVMPLMAVSLLASCGSKTPVEHFVTFESYGGGHFPTQRVKDGETATAPTEKPVRGQDDFLGWFTDFDKPAYTFTEKVTDDITLYAGWEVEPDPETTCSFKFTGEHCSINGYKDEPFEIALPKGTQTQFQINPEDGYLLPTNDKTHFNIIKGSIDEYDATKGLIKIGSMSGDIEIEAKSELALVETYTITFHDGKTQPKIENIEPGSTITAGIPTVPAKSGFTPIGWCTDEAGTKVFDFATVKIYQDYDLYPGYTKNPEPAPTYTITFDKNGGTLGDDAEESIKNIGSGAEWGSIVNKTTQIASKTNHTFVGWGLSPNTPDKIEDSYKITDSFTAYAIFNLDSPAIIRFTDDSENCKLYYDGVPHENGVPFLIPAGVDVVLTVEPDDGYLPVLKQNLTFTGDGGSTGTFDPGKKEITVNLKQNSFNSIKATTTLSSKENLEAYNWPEIKTISEGGVAPLVFKVGDTKKVEVNGKDHDVRIIGFNHDALKSDKTKTAGITFEFANVITNSDGNADTTYWNFKDLSLSTNYKYSESTLNDYLNVGENCIFKKLPDELKADGIIKEVYKPVAEAEEPQSGEDPIYEINDTYTTKLFPLSYREITATGKSDYVKEEGSAYPFYTGSDYDTDGNRIKKKVGDSSDIGEYYWLRSPSTFTFASDRAWSVGNGGGLESNFDIHDNAYAVAPAFCI